MKSAKAVLSIIATMLLVSAFVFIIQSMTLGDSSSFMLSEEASKEEIEAYRMANSLDRNSLLRYIDFISSFFSFAWGRNIAGQEIKEIILSRFPITLALSLFSLVLSIIISIPFAVLSVSRKNGAADKALSIFSIVILSLPSFLIAFILILTFSFSLKWFPIAGYIPPHNSIIRFLGSLFLPSLTLALVNSAFFSRMFRECLIDNLDRPYTIALKAQGASGIDLVVKSAMKPSLGVIISLIAQSIATSISGSAIVESIFALPGIGSLLVSSVLSRDIRLSGTLIMLIAFIVSALFLLSDLLSLYLEPRLRSEE